MTADQADPPSTVPIEHDAAIGRVARSWGHLEHMVDLILWETAEVEQQFGACITAQMGWSESVGNHFSAAVSADGKRFLLNAKWQHFASIKPQDLTLLDADDAEVMNRPDAPDASAWTIHGTVHRQ